MQASLFNVFVRLSQKALDKSRNYYYPVLTRTGADSAALSDIAFTAMLQEIDAFGAQFRTAPTTSECGTDESPRMQVKSRPVSSTCPKFKTRNS